MTPFAGTRLCGMQSTEIARRGRAIPGCSRSRIDPCRAKEKDDEPAPSGHDRRGRALALPDLWRKQAFLRVLQTTAKLERDRNAVQGVSLPGGHENAGRREHASSAQTVSSSCQAR